MVPPDEPDPPDLRVKQMLDAKTAADLERWFGLPSFQELADKGVPIPEDPDVVAQRERRAQALAAADPALIAEVAQRVARLSEVATVRTTIALRIDPEVARIDYTMAEQRGQIAEPREVTLSDMIKDDLAACTPQALLRDLHRPELTFQKYFDRVDMSAEQRLDGSAACAEVMATRWKIELAPPPAREGERLLAELRQSRRESYAHLLPLIPTRRVTD